MTKGDPNKANHKEKQLQICQGTNKKATNTALYSQLAPLRQRKTNKELTLMPTKPEPKDQGDQSTLRVQERNDKE